MYDVPDRSEAGEYFFRYIDLIGPGDIRETLAAQERDALALFRRVSDEHSRHRYAPDKWSVREVLGHVNDTERVFAYRALWFARGLAGELPSFEQDVAAANAGADGRSWSSHVDEFRVVRAASMSLFQNLPDDAWMRRGVASGKPFTVRALAFVVAGHLAHHLDVLRRRYGAGGAGYGTTPKLS